MPDNRPTDREIRLICLQVAADAVTPGADPVALACGLEDYVNNGKPGNEPLPAPGPRTPRI